jgi:hypothetical protein
VWNVLFGGKMYYVNSLVNSLVNGLVSSIENKIYGYNPSYVFSPSEESATYIKSFPSEIWHEIFKKKSISDNKYVCSITKKMNESFADNFILYQLLFDKIKPSFKEKYQDLNSDNLNSFEFTHENFIF